jgi:hypothetical protein
MQPSHGDEASESLHLMEAYARHMQHAGSR